MSVDFVTMADDNCYRRLLAEFHKRGNYGVMFRNAMDDVAGKMVLSRVKSCVAFGTGSGEREIDLTRRLLPNLRSFQAVEIDPDSVKALQVAFRDNQLPGVDASVVETSLERWSGVDNPVDAVLFVNMLPHVHTGDRKALFQKLLTTYLSPAGIIVIVDRIRSIPSGFVMLKKRLGILTDGYEEMEKDLLDVGFRVLLTHDFRTRLDLASPSDDIVKFIQLLSGHKCSEQEVRTAIDDVFSQPNMDCLWKLAIFTK